MHTSAIRTAATAITAATLVLSPFTALLTASSAAASVDSIPGAVTTVAPDPVVPGEVIVKLRPGSVVPDTIGRARRTSDVSHGPEHLVRFGGANGEAVPTQDETRAIAAALSKQPGVEYAQPNYVYQHLGSPDPGVQPQTNVEPGPAPSPPPTIGPVQICFGPNDPLYKDQWHYGKISLPCTWSLKTKGQGSPVIAVIDTGKTRHPDLAGKFLPGYDFISNVSTANDGNGRDANPTDPGDAADCGKGFKPNSWHGTHVAGTIGAATNNNLGVAGVNWYAQIVPVRVLGVCGGSLSDLTAAIRWAAGIAVPGVPPNPHPAKIINLSLGYYLGAGKTCSLNDPSLQSAINDVTTQKGVSVVVAAGNDNVDAKAFSPASCNNTVTVAATARDHTKAWYSNFGPSIDVAAPGGETKDANGVIDENNDGKPDGVLSTLLNSNGSQFIYAYYQGTSMAAPHVTGVISLMLAKNPAMTPAQLLAQLKATAKPLAAGLGAGLVYTYTAVQ